MAVLAVSLAPNVSLTLIQEGEIWRFGSWSRHPWAELPPPSLDDLARRFTNAELAVEHFRSLVSRQRIALIAHSCTKASARLPPGAP